MFFFFSLLEKKIYASPKEQQLKTATTCDAVTSFGKNEIVDRKFSRLDVVSIFFSTLFETITYSVALPRPKPPTLLRIVNIRYQS